MIFESILIGLTTLLIAFGVAIGYGLGRERGQRLGYRRGFQEGVEFSRRLRRQQRGRPLYPHLKLVQSTRRTQ